MQAESSDPSPRAPSSGRQARRVRAPDTAAPEAAASEEAPSALPSPVEEEGAGNPEGGRRSSKRAAPRRDPPEGRKRK